MLNKPATLIYGTLIREKSQALGHAQNRHSRGTTMEESLVNVEFLKSSSNYIARIQSELGGLREYRAGSFEEVLEQVIIDLQEEFESSP